MEVKAIIGDGAYSERYKIEDKNVGLKNNYSYDKANTCVKLGITIQGATALFLVNMKRIIKLNEEKYRRITPIIFNTFIKNKKNQ